MGWDEHRAQIYFDLSAYQRDVPKMLEPLLSHRGEFAVQLEPSEGANRWAIQCALRGYFVDGRDYERERLEKFAAEMEYIPPLLVHRAILLDTHDRCPMPHGED